MRQVWKGYLLVVLQGKQLRVVFELQDAAKRHAYLRCAPSRLVVWLWSMEKFLTVIS